MNLVLHNKAAGEVVAGNTFSDPYYKEPKNEEVLRRFDFAVSNPPFSLKNWTDGLKEYGRFEGYGHSVAAGGPFTVDDLVWFCRHYVYNKERLQVDGFYRNLDPKTMPSYDLYKPSDLYK